MSPAPQATLGLAQALPCVAMLWAELPGVAKLAVLLAVLPAVAAGQALALATNRGLMMPQQAWQPCHGMRPV